MIFIGQEHKEYESPDVIFFVDIMNYPFRLSEEYFQCGFITLEKGFINYRSSVNSVKQAYPNHVTIFTERFKYFQNKPNDGLSAFGEYLAI